MMYDYLLHFYLLFVWLSLDLPTQLEVLQDSELLLEIACCGLEVSAPSNFGWQVFNLPEKKSGFVKDEIVINCLYYYIDDHNRNGGGLVCWTGWYSAMSVLRVLPNDPMNDTARTTRNKSTCCWLKSHSEFAILWVVMNSMIQIEPPFTHWCALLWFQTGVV